MNRILTWVMGLLFLSASFGAAAFAATGDDPIPQQVEMGHWSCREIADLAARYEAAKKLPAAPLVERKELADTLYALLDKVIRKCELEGPEAVPREDLDRMARLYEALKGEMAQFEGYLTRREAIEKILARPEEKEPPFEYKVGVGGFLRGEGTGNLTFNGFAYTPGHREGRFLYRVKPYAYWHPTDYLDLHLEGQGYGFAGPGEDRRKYGLYQGFLVVRLPEKQWLEIKGGRQELAYGSSFILGADTFFKGLSYDAAKLTVRPLESLAIDLYWGTYAKVFSDGLDGNLSGAYATYGVAEGTTLELYAVRDSGSVNHRAGEKRYSWGFRATARLGPLGFELEPVYQSGEIFNETKGGNDRIDAYGGHLDATFETALAGYNNRLFVSYAFGSGSKAAAEGGGARREFANQNNDTSLVGDMSVIGDLSGLSVGDFHASGLQVYTLGWGIDISKELNFSATGRYFAARFVPDGFSRHLGLETDFTLTCNLSEDISLILGYDRFFTGKFFSDASGERGDINYGYAMLQFNLAHAKLKKPAKS